MGGLDKGRLVAPDGSPIALRTKRLLEEAGLACVLVGTPRAAYDELALPALADDPAAAGPLAGLLALLAWAGERAALAVACDLPRLDRALIERLVGAPPAAVVAPRRIAEPGSGRRPGRQAVWEPLFARYDPPRVLPVARALAASGVHRLQRLLDDAGAIALPLSRDEEALLDDWDRPEDALPCDDGRGTNRS